MKQCWWWLSVLPAVHGIITSFLTDISSHERRQIQVHLSDSRLQFVFPDRSRKSVNIRLSNLIITPSEATTYLIVQDQQEEQLHFSLESDSWLKSAIIQRKIKDTMRRRIDDGEAYDGISPLDFLRSQFMEDDKEGSMTDRKKFSFLAKDESPSPSASANVSSGEPANESPAKPALKDIISTASSVAGSYEVTVRREGSGLSTIESEEAVSDSISTNTDNDLLAEPKKGKKKVAEEVKIDFSVSSNNSDVVVTKELSSDHKPGMNTSDQPSAEQSEKANLIAAQDLVQVEAKPSGWKQEPSESSGSIHEEEARPSEINGERLEQKEKFPLEMPKSIKEPNAWDENVKEPANNVPVELENLEGDKLKNDPFGMQLDDDGEKFEELGKVPQPELMKESNDREEKVNEPKDTPRPISNVHQDPEPQPEGGLNPAQAEEKDNDQSDLNEVFDHEDSRRKLRDLSKASSDQADSEPQAQLADKSKRPEAKESKAIENPKGAEPQPSIISIESKPQSLEPERLKSEYQEMAQTEANEVLKEIETKDKFVKPDVIHQPSPVETRPQKPDFPEPKDEGLQQRLEPTGVNKFQSMNAAHLFQVPNLVAHESSLVNFESLSIAHALPGDLLKEDVKSKESEPEIPNTKREGMTTGPEIQEPEARPEPEQPKSNAAVAKVLKPKSNAAEEKIQEPEAKSETPIIITLTKIPNPEVQTTPRKNVQRPEVIVIPTIEVQPEGEPAELKQPEPEKKAEDKPLRVVIIEPKDLEELPEPEIAEIKPVESHGKIKEIRFEGNPAPPKLTNFAIDDADLGSDGSVTLKQAEGIFAAGQWAHIRASCLLKETAVSHPRSQGNGGFKMYKWKSNDPAELPIVPNPSRALYHCLGSDDPKLDHFPSILLASHNFVEGPSPKHNENVVGWNKNRSGMVLKKEATFSQLASWLKETQKWTKEEACIDLFSRTQYGRDSKVQTNVILQQIYYDFNAEPNANLKGRLADVYTELYTQVILTAISRHETGLDYIFLSTGQASLPDVLAEAALRAASSLSTHLGGIKIVLVSTH